MKAGVYIPSHQLYMVKGYDKDDFVITFSAWEDFDESKERRLEDKKVKGVHRVELVRILMKSGNCHNEYAEYEVIYKN